MSSSRLFSSCGISEDNFSRSLLKWLANGCLVVMRWRVSAVSARGMKGFTNFPMPMLSGMNTGRDVLCFRPFSTSLKLLEPSSRKTFPEKNILEIMITVYSDQGRSIPSPTVSEVLYMHEERERQRRRFPTSASVGSRIHSIRRMPSVHGGSRIYFEHHV